MKTRYVNLRIPTTGNDTMRAEILVDGELIEEVVEADPQTTVGGEQWVDLEDALVLPGVVDPQVDFSDPGFPLRGDFTSATAAAAAGGVTCVADLPHGSYPAVTTSDAFDLKVRVASSKSHVDFLIWGGISGQRSDRETWADHLEKLSECGAAGIFVTLRSHSPDFWSVDFEHLAEIAKRCNSLGVLLAVHAENDDLITAQTAAISSTGAVDPTAWSMAHPAESEYSAVAVVREICRSTGARIHLTNLSTSDGADMIVEGIQEALPVSAATSPSYLEFTGAHLADHGSQLKLIPALKEPGHNARLWHHIRDGAISVVSSSHAAVQWPEEKTTDSIWKDRAGWPSVELTLPYLFSEGVCTGRLSLEQMVRLVSKNPADLFKIGHLKGALHPGMHADFVVFDDNQTWPVQPTALHGPNAFTPLEGLRLTGRVRATFQRGRCIFRRTPDGQEMFGPAGSGKWIQRGQKL